MFGGGYRGSEGLAFQKAARGMITEVNCFGYAGCEVAYNHGEPWRQELLKVLRENRDLLYSTLTPHGKSASSMEATYLAMTSAFRGQKLRRILRVMASACRKAVLLAARLPAHQFRMSEVYSGSRSGAIGEGLRLCSVSQRPSFDSKKRC